MRPLSSLLGLPASLPLLLLFTVTVHVRGAQANARGLPTAIRKMSPDAGEKLFQEYFAFEEEDQVSDVATQAQAANQTHEFLEPGEEEDSLAFNSSATVPYYAPYAPHYSPDVISGRESGWDLPQRARDVIARLQKREYSCPTGSTSCSSIGYPNSCCQTGTECVEITDTGLGSVGCCPDGISCSGSIACSGSETGCPSNIGGGCCIEGYVCASVGCVQSSTATTTLVTRTSTLTTTIGGSPTTTVVTVTVISSSSSSTYTSEATSTYSSQAQTSTTTTETLSTASSTTATSTSPTTSPGAPVRPTSISTTTTTSGEYCPTGYYACSAVYGGGCCQTGRDCQTTSCPSTASTTIISSGQTVVVPLTAVPSSTASTGTCAGGWTLCPSDAGATAGCCPSDYSCGTASCFLATGSATASVAKELTGSGAVRGEIRWWGVVLIPTVVGFAFGMALI